MDGNTLLVSVIYFGHIPLLGINGPMVNPQALNRGLVGQLVSRGYEVYSHNPYNRSQKKRLTMSNVYTNIWPPKEPEPVKPVQNIGTPVPTGDIGITIKRKPAAEPAPAPIAPVAVEGQVEVTVIHEEPERLPEPEATEQESTPEATSEPVPEPEKAPVVNPYAGMSKNQRRKAKAAAAAKAAAEKAASGE